MKFRLRKRKYTEINPDEILLDSSNLPNFDKHQLEGRLEKPIGVFTLYSLGVIISIIFIIFAAQAWKLQIANGETYKERSERNMLRPVPVFAGRGVIFDRKGKLIAWNSPNEKAALRINPDTDPHKNVAGILTAVTTNEASTTEQIKLESEFSIAKREYATSTGLSHVLGYIQYPSKDKNGFYYREDFKGIAGVEQYFDNILHGKNGSRLVEVDARGKVISENIVQPAEQGKNVNLSIDSDVQSALFNNIKDVATRIGYQGGAGVIMDVKTGEILAVTSYPEYSSQAMSDGIDIPKIRASLNDPALPFLDRAVDGLYTPGSIVKPFLALGALNEKIIDPNTIVTQRGSISVPNPYDSTKTSVFRDWKDHGFLDMRHAISLSSDVYFYVIGGGYKGQKGLGIANIDKYLNSFGFGLPIPESFVSGKSGTIPTPEWKLKTFNESWYLGNTYHTSIGQYGTLVTPVQATRAVAAVANYGKLLVPTIVKDETPKVEKTIDVSPANFKVIHEGMRLSATEGTSPILNVPYVKVASKSGTAELGESRQQINSWITGFWPYENPRYAFAVMLEKGDVKSTIGATTVIKQQLDWMNENTPEYLQP